MALKIGRRPQAELYGYTQLPCPDIFGMGLMVYGPEDLPPTDPVGAGLENARSWTMTAPVNWQVQYFGSDGNPGVQTGAIAMQPLANPAYTSQIATGALTF